MRRPLLWCLLAIWSTNASETVFSVNDDVLAYPQVGWILHSRCRGLWLIFGVQFEIVFSESYISEAAASRKLGKTSEAAALSDNEPTESQGELSDFRSIEHAGEDAKVDSDSSKLVEDYERLVLKGRPFLCSLPRINNASDEEKVGSTSTEDQEKDLITAADRGWELLRDLEGKCMFFVSGWWSYSFCYNSQVKQFHQLPPGNGGPIYPPQEDPSTPSYVLGKFSDKKTDQRVGDAASSVTTRLQTKGDSRYLVQKFGRGTTCDLTGEDRRVEVQFHCHPQSKDRIGWIKEVATCTYLMIIYTPRLCNEVAFLPPRQNKAHIIACREIVKPDELADWKSRKSAEAARYLIDQSREAPLMAGEIEIGAMKDVGREGRQIEKGRVVSPPEERAEVVAMQRNGKQQWLSKEDLKKLDLDPETVAAFRKKIQNLAGKKDWKVEKIDDEQGVTQLRGIVASDEDGDQEFDGVEEDDDREAQRGSEERYKQAV